MKNQYQIRIQCMRFFLIMYLNPIYSENKLAEILLLPTINSILINALFIFRPQATESRLSGIDGVIETMLSMGNQGLKNNPDTSNLNMLIYSSYGFSGQQIKTFKSDIQNIIINVLYCSDNSICYASSKTIYDYQALDLLLKLDNDHCDKTILESIVARIRNFINTCDNIDKLVSVKHLVLYSLIMNNDPFNLINDLSLKNKHDEKIITSIVQDTSNMSSVIIGLIRKLTQKQHGTEEGYLKIPINRSTYSNLSEEIL
jgi:hypothetical protein